MKLIMGLLILWWCGAALVCLAILKSSRAKDEPVRRNLGNPFALQAAESERDAGKSLGIPAEKP